MALSQDAASVCYSFFLKSQFLKICEYVRLSNGDCLGFLGEQRKAIGNPDTCSVVEKCENK